MKFKKTKTLTLSIMLFSALTYSALASESCDILVSGNKYYGKDNAKAIDIYKKIEGVDLLGKDRCTASIYATIGTIYKIKGDKSVKSSNNEKTVAFYKLSTKYNRAFANALMCNQESNCKASEEAWKKGSFWDN